MIDLREALKEYLALRRSLGFKLRWVDTILSGFLDHLERAASPMITTVLALEWAISPKGRTRCWWAKRLNCVRGFALYLHARDPRNEVPSAGLIPNPSRRQPVYVYSDSDVMNLMAVAGELRDPFRALTHSTLIGLLAATGLRVSEAINLERNDVDWEEAVLTIRDSKFGKSREVVVHPTTIDALRKYERERRHRFPRNPCPSFFLSLAGKRPIYQNVHFTFFRLIDRAGLADRQPRRPRIHDLRHTFATRTLSDWYRAGVDVERKLPLLSTYLGHVDPTTTYWYLTSTPELMDAAKERMENRLGDLP